MVILVMRLMRMSSCCETRGSPALWWYSTTVVSAPSPPHCLHLQSDDSDVYAAPAKKRLRAVAAESAAAAAASATHTAAPVPVPLPAPKPTGNEGTAQNIKEACKHDLIEFFKRSARKATLKNITKEFKKIVS